MSNPWTYSPRDIALAPLYKTLKTLPKDTKNSHNENTGNNSNISSTETTEKKKRITFIDKLRQADQFNRDRRNDPFLSHNLSPEQAKIITIARRLTKIFLVLSKSLETFQKADNLKAAYLQAFVENQIIWDEISYENKHKLVITSQQLLRQLTILLENQETSNQQTLSRHNSFALCISNLKNVVQKTQILGVSGQEVDKIEVEDLFDVLSQCVATLEDVKVAHNSNLM